LSLEIESRSRIANPELHRKKALLISAINPKLAGVSSGAFSPGFAVAQLTFLQVRYVNMAFVISKLQGSFSNVGAYVGGDRGNWNFVRAL